MSTKGMIYPQEKPMLAGNPKDSAIAANNQAITNQSNLIKATSGGNRHKNKKSKYGGATGGVVVPQYQMQYTPTGADGQNPNDIITQNAGVSVQGAENAKYDSLAKVGGSSRKKRGGSLKWGCYSGGRKKSRSRSYKRKTHKKRRTKRRK
jgi:hypothetical protein